MAADESKQWARDAVKSRKARAVVDNLAANASCVPDKDNVPLSTALFQTTLNKCGGNHQGLLLDVPKLLDGVQAAAGLVSQVIFVGCGLGHAERALAELMRRTAAADPVRFSGLQGFRAIYSSIGSDECTSAPPASAWWDDVLAMDADKTIRTFGHTETVVFWILPPSENPAAVKPIDLAAVMASRGVPNFWAFMETPTSTFEPEELKAAVKSFRDNEDGKPIPITAVAAVTSFVIDDDSQPKSSMDRHLWRNLNSLYLRSHMLPEYVHSVPRWQSAKRMRWIGFVLRPLPTQPPPPFTEAPLPKLEGANLSSMVARYATLLKSGKHP